MSLIALVDDEDSVAASLKLVLRMYGLSNTVSYADPEDLLRDMREGLTPDVVVTDFYMPGTLNGVELLDAVGARYGEIPGIIVTGYPEGIGATTKSGRVYPILCKGQPDFFRDLVRSIEHALTKENAAVRNRG